MLNHPIRTVLLENGLAYYGTVLFKLSSAVN